MKRYQIITANRATRSQAGYAQTESSTLELGESLFVTAEKAVPRGAGVEVELFDTVKNKVLRSRYFPTLDEARASVARRLAKHVESEVEAAEASLAKFTAEINRNVASLRAWAVARANGADLTDWRGGNTDVESPFRWADDSVAAAARLMVAREVEEYLATDRAPSAIVAALRTQVLRSARNGLSRSTSSSANLTEEARLAARAAMVEKLETIVAWATDMGVEV